MLALSPVLLHVALLASHPAAQGGAQPRADLFPLGPLGGAATVTHGSQAATLAALDEGGLLAKAGLRVGDQLIAVGGTPFAAYSRSYDTGGDGPQRALGEAVDAAGDGTTAAARQLRLRVSRPPQEAVASEGHTAPPEPRQPVLLDIDIELPARTGLAGPDAADGRRDLRDAAAAQLLRLQGNNGMWNAPVGLTGDRTITAWALLALLAHVDPQRPDAALDAACDRAARWLRGRDETAWLPADLGKGPDNLGNWALCSTAIALAEHHHRTGDPADLPVIHRCNRALATRMTEQGRFGHDVTVGYGGKGLNVINAQAQLAWALGASVGIPVDAVAWQRSLDELAASIDPNGGVRYWTLPRTGTGDASLRTSATALALLLQDERPQLRIRLLEYLDAHPGRVREAHAVGSLGMLVQAPTLRAWDHAAYRRFLAEWRWYLALTRGPDDRIHYIGGKGNNGGDSYLGRDIVAAVIALQITAQDSGQLQMVRGVLARDTAAHADGPDPASRSDG